MRSWEASWPSWPADDEPAEAGAPAAAPEDDARALPPLTGHDRCDVCGAQAYVRVRLSDGGELMFCGHHGHALRPLLLQTGATLRDDTHLLLT